MNAGLVEKEIRESVSVNPHNIMIAKKFIHNQSNIIEVSSLIDQFTATQGYPKIHQIVIHESANIEDQIKKASGYLSWYMAFSHAILELVHANFLIPLNQQMYPFSNNLSIGWTTVVPGSGGHSSTWSFNDYTILVPSHLKKSIVQTSHQQFILFDVNLFISNLDIRNADEEVIEALKDTISCFKQELYRPSLTMLGKAVEGAWIEMGISLLDYAISKNIEIEKNTRLKERLMGPDSFVFKIEKVTDLYSSHYKDWFNEIKAITSINPSQLQEIKIWTNVVRESRNAIHFGVKVSSENTYEKTAIILLASISHLKTMYYLKKIADDKQ